MPRTTQQRQQLYRLDPTRTATIRARYTREMRKRFRWFRGILVDALVTKDVLGLKEPSITVQADSGLPPRRFDFPRTADKVAAFMDWLRKEVERGILEVRQMPRIGSSVEDIWQNVFIEDTYKRGVMRATQELGKASYPGLQSIEARGGIALVMGMPMHADRLGLLFSRAFGDLQGITDAMEAQISRVLTQGLADGDSPRLLAKKLNAVVAGGGGDLGIHDTLGRFIPAERRAEMLTRTETIRAHHKGMMQEYRNWGLEGLHVQAEVRTAGDSRVCAVCEALEGRVYTLNEAENLLPVHPNCRCIVLPHLDFDDFSVNSGSPHLHVHH